MRLQDVEQNLARDAARSARVASSAHSALKKTAVDEVLSEFAAFASPVTVGPVRLARSRVAAHFRNHNV